MIDLKQIFPIEFNYKLKNFKKFVFQKKMPFVINKEDKYVYFLDVPSYGNLGDQAIAFAMEKYIGECFKDYKQIEFQESNVINYIKSLKKTLKKDDIICLTGGGNMGIMYQKYEALRRLLIKSFPNNKILIFPQTICYENNKYANKEFIKSKKIYNNKNLLLMAREEKTYEIMLKNYNKCQIVLCPDIVLYLNYHNIVKQKKDTIGICLRNDKEKNISIPNGFINTFNKKTRIVSTLCKDQNININNREQIIMNKLREFAENEIIITDRLHGMIFSYITNTFCIALPNSNGKVEGVYNWIENKGTVFFDREFTGQFIFKNKESKELVQEFHDLRKKIYSFVDKE